MIGAISPPDGLHPAATGLDGFRVGLQELERAGEVLGCPAHDASPLPRPARPCAAYFLTFGPGAFTRGRGRVFT